MGDRLLEDLEITLSSFSEKTTDQYDYHDDEDETEGEYDYEEEVNARVKESKLEELGCPFCPEDFDVLGLCCHIDADHRMEVKSGICPVCLTKVRINMASHVITQHENALKSLCIKKNCSARSRSAILLLRNDLQEKHLRFMKESHSVESSPHVATDSKLLSFVNNQNHAHRTQSNQTATSTEASISAESHNGDLLESIQLTPSTDWNNERKRRCVFSQGLVLSTIFDDL